LGNAAGGKSLKCGLTNSASSFSRYRASISGPLVSSTSHRKRPALASDTARCRTFSELERHKSVLRPYFFSKAWVMGPESRVLSEV
jgi:hypothetical protein